MTLPPATHGRFLSSRRRLLAGLALSPLAVACTTPAATRGAPADSQAALARLEDGLDGRLGVFAIDTGSGTTLGHRAGERFPICSTFKAVLAGAVLARSAQEAGLLARRIRYTKADLVSYSPVTAPRVDGGMTVAELCAATVQHSDNTAGNLLLRLVGGPPGLTAFARAQGDTVFRLDRWETDLNTALPGDARDTSTPEAMARLLRRLAVDGGLPSGPQQQLQDWLRGNTTGDQRVRAGVPAGWRVGDKTGTGSYGAASDIAVLWRPDAPPLVLAVYIHRRTPDAGARDDAIAGAARIVADWATAAGPAR